MLQLYWHLIQLYKCKAMQLLLLSFQNANFIPGVQHMQLARFRNNNVNIQTVYLS